MPYPEAGQMEDDVDVTHQRRHGLCVADICHDEFDVLAEHAIEILPPAVDQVVDDAYGKSLCGQLTHEFGSNESGAAGHQNTLH